MRGQLLPSVCWGGWGGCGWGRVLFLFHAPLNFAPFVFQEKGCGEKRPPHTVQVRAELAALHAVLIKYSNGNYCYLRSLLALGNLVLNPSVLHPVSWEECSVPAHCGARTIGTELCPDVPGDTVPYSHSQSTPRDCSSGDTVPGRPWDGSITASHRSLSGMLSP